MEFSVKDIVTRAIVNIPVEVTESESQLFNTLPQQTVLQSLKELFYESNDATIRSRAFDAILKLKGIDVVGFLLEAFDRLSFGWQSACCRCLAKEKDPRAIIKLSNILLTNENADLRYIAAESLGENGDESALSALKQAILHDNGVDYEGFQVSEVAKFSLAKILDSMKLQS